LRIDPGCQTHARYLLRPMKVILAYKNFAANRHISHIGLGVAALNTCKTLIKHGIPCEVWPIIDGVDLRQRLNSAISRGDEITNVVISAPWIPTHFLNHLCGTFPAIHFAVNCHSNVGFLQADPNGMRLIREGLDLEMALPNFEMAANSQKMCRWIEDAYGSPCRYLPNLYFMHKMPLHPNHWKGGVLRIGCFGAIRPQKNLASAVGAAVEISHRLKADTEIWVSSGRFEGGGAVVLNTVRAMVEGLPMVKLREGGWLTWPQFRTLVKSMNLLLQPSSTESFNMVTADGIAEGVPSVVSEAIDWAPEHWKANADEVFDISRVGISLLRDPHAYREGWDALAEFVEQGLISWRRFARE
jgi:glycosyltransferase involved in cell wall biosynthesis